jgi:spermidine/putrescine transport system ATP-binding protein
MLELDGVTTAYGEFTAVDDVSLSVAEGELCCLLGPSGSGKSTLLRTVAGFETPDTGRVRVAGEDVTDRAPNARDCSMVFQDWALFPHKTVLENVAFGPKMRGVATAERHETAREQLSLVEMDGYADATPDELSGGQKQRVALARSLAVEPDLLLLDEPLSNLDRRLRETMQLELKRIHDRVGTTMLYVTHDQDEAFTLADRLGVMADGRLVQVDAPGTVYDDPTDRFVESFLGSTNFVEARVDRLDDRPLLDTALGTAVRAPLDPDGIDAGESIAVSLRPERLSVVPAGEQDPATASPAASGPAVEDGGTDRRVSVTGEVSEAVHRGATVRVRLRVGETDLFVDRPTTAERSVAAGDRLAVRFDPHEALYFDDEGERCR